MCDHKNFKAQVDVTRLTENDDLGKVIGYRAEIEIHCMDCFMPFRFVGLPGGYLPDRPTISIEGTRARMPIKPI
jgi:hypothetical protein